MSEEQRFRIEMLTEDVEQYAVHADRAAARLRQAKLALATYLEELQPVAGTEEVKA